MKNVNLPVDLRNSQGFGLLSVVMAMGLATVLFLGILNILYLTANAQRGVQIKADRALYLSNLSSLLTQDATCTPSIRGNPASGPIAIVDPADPARTMARAGQKFQSWNIVGVELRNERVVDGAMSLHAAEVVLTLEHPFKLVGVAPRLIKELATIYYATREGSVTRCFGTTNWATVAKNYCGTLGGTWSDSEIQCSLPTSATVASTETPTMTVAQIVVQANGNAEAAVSGSGASAVTTGKKF
jgi:hypothetical protein